MTQAAGRSILMVVRGLDAVGTGRQIELVAAGFRAAGWRVHIAVTTSGGTVAERLNAAGFPVHRLGARPRVDPGATAKLPFVVRSVGPCVIHAWGRSQARIVGGLRGLLRPALTVCHLAVGPRDRFTAWSLRRADRVIVTSAGVAGRCEAFGVRSGRIDIIPPGIDAAAGTTRSREEIARRLGLRGDSPWTLCVAPLDAEARLERLLWAIDQLDVEVFATPPANASHWCTFSTRHGLTPYDAQYIDLALQHRCAIATCDAAVAQAATQLGLTVLD
jgi:glycosyltransferase involved in cell wall biosynthesis